MKRSNENTSLKPDPYDVDEFTYQRTVPTYVRIVEDDTIISETVLTFQKNE